ncbi:MAG TPA: histidine kinase [Gaiellaceae bacterium]
MQHDGRDRFEALLWGEVLLFGLLGATLAFFLAYPDLRPTYHLPQLRLVLQTAITLAAGIVAVLAATQFAVDRKRLDLLLAGGFTVAAGSTFAFSIVPALGGQPLHRAEAWAGIGGRLLATSLVASAAFVRGRTRSAQGAVAQTVVSLGLLLVSFWIVARWLGPSLPPVASTEEHNPPLLLTLALSLQALLNLTAVVGFTRRFRNRGRDLDRWIALGTTLLLFASLNYMFSPLLASGSVSAGDFLRILGYGVLLAGVWCAIRSSEFGRAVAEERARVAREIHDGLAQYLFAVSTHASMLEAGAPVDEVLPRLKEAAAAAQQEARFAVLALSSASGTAPFDAALRRYVEFLTADGKLDVELELDPAIALAPDEQIEVFRIVQEGLANVRRHADATSCEVTIAERAGQRVVRIRDDGDGFDEASRLAGQGLKNIRARTASIDGGFTLTSWPGWGTELEVVLRAS